MGTSGLLRRAGERASRGRDHRRGLGEALGDSGSAPGGVPARSDGRDLLAIRLSTDQLVFRRGLE
jgi:hypothetical protein